MLNIVKPTGIVLLIVVATQIIFASTPARKVLHLSTGESISILKNLDCDNVTNGGAIAGDEYGCPNPLYDPGLIYNVLLPSGGTGVLEYVWMYTNENPNYGTATWSALPNSNAPDYNPGPITITTYYMRCSRRAGCSLYIGETNFVKKAVECCPGNVTDGGKIGPNQNSCTIPFDPQLINNITSASGGSGTIDYQWLVSTVGGSINNGTWAIIAGATDSSYDPPTITKTSYYIRRAKVKFCTEYEYANVVKVTLTNGVKITMSKTDPSCFEANNGSATVTITQGTPTFMINWSNQLNMVKTIINLGGGMYMVTVTDANGCTAKGLVTLDEPTEIEIKGTTSAEKCNVLGTINISVSGGSPPYKYLWSTGDTIANLINKGAGNYTITVTDSKGCTKSKLFIIQDETNIILTPKVINNNCFGGSSGSISVTVSGGVSPYTYKWSNSNVNISPVISNLTAGNYTVTVTDKANCSKVQTFIVTENTEIVSTGSITNAKCFGSNDGSIITSTNGGVSPYTYKWSYNNQITPNLLNVGAGAYVLTITDALGCSRQQSFIVNQGIDINVAALLTKPICYNDTTGSIDITVTGGYSPYTYTWNGVSANQDITNKKAGMYVVKVTDSIGCSKQVVFFLQNPPDIKVSAAVINPFCKQNNGSIAITTTGGSPGYTYLWSTSDTTKNLSNVSAGIYSLTVTDSKGCIKVSSFSVSDDNGLLITELITNEKCYGDHSASIQISFTGGVPPYLIYWSNGASNTQKINDLAAGTYSITVIDANQCKGIKLFNITEPDQIILTETLNIPTCNANLGGSIILSVTGGKSPYKYEWSNGNKLAINSNLAAGTYTVTVTDNTDCSVVKSIVLTEPDKLDISAVVVNPLCNQTIDGSIDITVTGGTLPYSYLWNNIPSGQDQFNLSAGIYTVKVTDKNDCTVEKSFEIVNPEVLTISSKITNATCGNNTGKIELVITGGSGVYNYLWSNTSTVKDLSLLYPGNYSVTVTDSNGCSKESAFVVIDQNSLQIADTITNVKCFGDHNASIHIGFSGGLAPYLVNWSNGMSNTLSISNLASGTYVVTVIDANQCKGNKSFYIPEPELISISESLNSPSCNGNLTGNIALSVSGGTIPFKYEWNNGSNTETNSNIGAGTYTVTVTDSNDCSLVKSIILTEPDKLTLAGVVTNPLCNQDNNGSINLTVSGGTLPYSYIWNNIPSGKDQNNLGSGIYLVKVTDKNDCTLEKSFELTEPNEVVIESTIVNTSCGLNNGKISLIVSGGSGIYNFLWSNTLTDKDLKQLSPGKYSVTVSDNNGCSKSADFTVIDKGDIKITANIKDNKCGDDLEGSIEIAITNGVQPYTIQWSNNITDTNKITGLATGTYTVTVTDYNQCSLSKSFEILAPPSINITGTVSNEKCTGMKIGSIDLTVSGGLPGYSYLWSNGLITQNNANLPGGVFIVTVTDQNTCSKTAIFTITEPLPISLNQSITELSCNGGTNGAISIFPSGGTPIYTYVWSNGNITNKQTALSAGIYTVTVTDSNQCSMVQDFILTDPPSLDVSSNLIKPSCNGGLNGSITLNVSGGTAPYKYIWSNGKTTANLVSIGVGNYTVTITDNKGCSKVESYSLSEGSNLQILESITPISCKGSKNGKITVSLIGGIAPYTYKWNPSIYTGASISNLGPGIYAVTISDQSGCKTVKQFNLTEPNALGINIIKQDISCNNTNNAKLTAIPTGGTPGYIYKWSNNADTSTIEGLIAGSYTITVTDKNECIAHVTTTLTNPSEIILSAKAGKTSCYNTMDATIDLTVNGGTAPYTYIWNNNAVTQDLKGLGEGNYSVTVTDTHGCTMSGTYGVGSPLPISFDVLASNESCLNQNDGKAFVTNITGGSPAYNFKWNDSKNTTAQSIFNLSPGFYQVTVKDIKGCAANKTIEIMPSKLKCTSNLGDYVWLDINKNGIQDTTETGVNGIVVHLINVGDDGILDTGDDILVATKTTKTDNGKKGYYLFKDVPKANYVIRFYIDHDKYTFTFKDKANNDAKDSDVNPSTSATDVFEVKPGDQDNLTYDAGIFQYCDNITHGGLVCCDESLCTPGQVPTLIANVEYPSGGTGAIEYLWLYSTTDPNYSPGNPGWIMIPNSNTPSYQPGPLSETTYFVRCSKRGDCTNFAGESNIVTKKVVDGKVAQINGAPPSICKNESVNFTSVDYGAGVSYLWDLGDGGIPGVATTNDVLTKWSFPGVKTIKLYVSYDGCTSSDVVVLVVAGCIAKTEVINFTAILNSEHQVDLKWKVDNINNHLFEIQRSQDNNTFIAIDAVDGLPDNEGNYKIKDIKPAIGVNYYRIKIFDSDANYKFTKVEDVLLEDFENQNLVVYPNPATNVITVEPIRYTKRPGIIEISNAYGALMYQKELEAEFKQFDIDISKYVSGTYFVRIKIDGKRDLIFRIFKIE